MEIPGRVILEARFAARITKLTNRHRRELKRLLGNPPDTSRVTQEFWDRVQQETEEESIALLLLLFLASASAHVGTGFRRHLPQIRARADTYSTRTAIVLSQRYVKAARVSLENRRKEWIPTQGEPTTGEDGEVIPAPAPEGPTQEDIDVGLTKVFGPGKAEEIAVSETTDAQSAGGEAAADIKSTKSERDLWITEEDARVCPICQPLNRKPRSVWSGIFPEGPKAHPQCRCWIEYENERPVSESTLREVLKGFKENVPGGHDQKTHGRERGTAASKTTYAKEKERDSEKQAAEKQAAKQRTERTAAKRDQAKRTHKPSTKEKQRAAEANEQSLVDSLGAGRTTGDNLPMDVVVELDGKKIGIEVKTMLDNKNSKITMHPASRNRKEKWAEDSGGSVHTVIYDNRNTFQDGQFSEQYSGHGLYYRSGVGAYRVGSMTKIDSMDQLKGLLSNPTGERSKFDPRGRNR